MAFSLRRLIALLLCGALISASGGAAYAQTARIVIGKGAGTFVPMISLPAAASGAGTGLALQPSLLSGSALLSAAVLPEVLPVLLPATALQNIRPLLVGGRKQAPPDGESAERTATAHKSAIQAASSDEESAQRRDASPETLRVGGWRVFDGAVVLAESGGLVPAPAWIGRGYPLRVSPPSGGEAKVRLSVPALARTAVASVRNDRRTQGLVALALGLLAAVAMPSLGAGALALPIVLGTCNVMQERAIKDAAILPEMVNTERQQLAKKELDLALVNFGKRLKAEAAKDDRVATAVSAHAAEHGMENPLLALLPAWKAAWAEGKGPTKEEARLELRAAVLAELQRTALTNESPALIEELLNKTGSWEELLAWEERYQILDSLKKAAEKERAKTQHGQVATKANTSSGLGSGAVMGLFLIGAIGLASTLAGLPIGAGLLGVAMMGGIIIDGDGTRPAPEPAKKADESASPPVPLDSYLNGLGLNAEEIAFLKEYTYDLGTRDLAPIIGRSKELQRVITILSKPPGTQNNPMMLGDKGVGKTAIIEAIAKYLYYNRLPSLKGKRILELDTGKLTAGTGIVGEMEKRLTNLRAIVAKTNNKVILFVDEIHSILKNNATSNAVPDLLKAPLRNGELTVIGATTVGEYRKYMESDPAFADRFDSVMVNEPTIEEGIEMLEGDIEYLERKFGVEIDPEAAQAAVKLSARYIPEKFLPRKARVLLESALAEAKPEAARDGVQVSIDHLTDRLRIFVKRYAALKKQNDPQRKAQEVQTYNRIVALYSTILFLEEKQSSFIAEKIGKDHVMRTLARETGMQLGDLGEDEYKRLLRMEPWFKERIVGQDEAIKALADTVRTNKAGFSDPNRPQGVFLFAGKTGVGKTALARTLADFLFSNPEAVIRLDMSEYMEKFAVQRLFGAPPGYVGYDSGGELTEKVRRQPYSVVLFDEIEKAHPDVLNALLQIFDAGRMTDGRQNTVNFKNTIIIMTTNLGSGSESEGEAFRTDVLEAIKARLRPEFINRVDKTVVFNPLVIAQAKTITAIMIKDVEKRLREQDLQLDVTPEALDYLATKGFDPAYGARPLKRVVESDVTGAISQFLLRKKAEGALTNGGVVVVAVQGGAISFDLRPNPPPSVELAPLPDGPLGAKLRRILEDAVGGSQSTKDIATFESILFADRGAVTLEPTYGAFRPNSDPVFRGAWGDEFSTGLGPEAAGMKDAALEALKVSVREKAGARWSSDTEPELAEAWLDAFAKLAKGMLPNDPPVVRFVVPRATGVAELTVTMNADAGYAATQRFARLARDHFSVALPDEDAVRVRAAALKDEGRAVDRDLLDLKRLVEAVPGASFGYAAIEASGFWKFWFRAPVGARAEPAAETPVNAATGAEQPIATIYRPLTAAPSSTPLATWKVDLEFQPAMWQTLAAKLKEAGVNSDASVVSRFWLDRARAAANANGAGAVTMRTARVESDSSLLLSLGIESSGRGALADEGVAALQATVAAIPGATFGYQRAPTDFRNAPLPFLYFWLRLPASVLTPAVQAAAPAAPAAPVTALDARLSAAKMFLFLTQRAPEALQAQRALIAEMLDSKSTYVRLMALHMASAVLSPAAFREVAATSRMLRLADAKDYVLFADLAKNNSGIAMASQRKGLSDVADGALGNFRGRGGQRYGSAQTNEDALYAELAAVATPVWSSTVSVDALDDVARMRSRYPKAVAKYLAFAVLIPSLAFVGYHFWLAWWIAAAIVAVILFFIWGAFLETYRGTGAAAAQDSVRYEALILRRLAAPQRARVVRSWLDKASRGNLPDNVDQALLGRLIADSEPLNARDSAKVYRRWQTYLEKGMERWKKTRYQDNRRLATLGLLGRLRFRVPGGGETSLTALLLAPLRERRLPDSGQQYLEGLGRWLSKARLSPEEFEDVLNLLVSFPLNSNASASSFLPVYRALAENPALPQELKTGFDLFLGGLVIENWASNDWTRRNAALELIRLRARLGFERQAWESMRETLEAYLTNKDMITADVFTTLDRFLRETPPPILEKAWLAPGLRQAVQISNNQSTKGMAALLLAKVLDSEEERLQLLIAALTDTAIDAGRPYTDIHAAMLKDLRAHAARTLGADAAAAAAWEAAVAENAARLSATP